MPERERKLGIKDRAFLLRFLEILPDLDRPDLSHYQMEEVLREHKMIVEACFDRGLVKEVCQLWDNYNLVHNKQLTNS